MPINNDPLDNAVSPRRAPIQILIVEDDYILAANLQENLESLGYDVSGIADTVEAAISQALQFRPDLVLMDIRLQGELDGIQAAKILWGSLRIPVIYVTGHSDRSTLERAQATLPYGYLLKPVKGPELEVALATFLHCFESK
ncbi:MAG: response regulator [Kovacikia sp.]